MYSLSRQGKGNPSCSGVCLLASLQIRYSDSATPPTPGQEENLIQCILRGDWHGVFESLVTALRDTTNQEAVALGHFLRRAPRSAK
jgi:hypothetical protein